MNKTEKNKLLMDAIARGLGRGDRLYTKPYDRGIAILTELKKVVRFVIKKRKRL